MTGTGSEHEEADALYEARRFEEALAGYRRALIAEPDSVPLQFNIANTLRDLKRYGEAIEAYDRALATAPGLAMAHHNRATCLLQLGHLEAGFQEYEWRKVSPGFVDDARYRLDRPWAGENLEGKALYIFCELFQGDLLQFGRYALLAEAVLKAKVTLSAPVAMHAILSTMSPTIRLIAEDAPPPAYDYHCALMSMPMLCRTSLSGVPALPAYLRAEPERVARWRARIGPAGTRIGIAWQGSARATLRSFPLAVAVERLKTLPNVRLISLQKGLGLEQLDALPFGLVEALGEDFDAGPDLFVDTAAAMTCCDVVITPDTSVAHVGGALGVRTLVVLPWAGDWRWLEDRTNTPWYPNVRLARQLTPGDWAGVFDRVAAALRQPVPSPSGGA